MTFTNTRIQNMAMDGIVLADFAGDRFELRWRLNQAPARSGGEAASCANYQYGAHGIYAGRRPRPHFRRHYVRRQCQRLVHQHAPRQHHRPQLLVQRRSDARGHQRRRGSFQPDLLGVQQHVQWIRHALYEGGYLNARQGNGAAPMIRAARGSSTTTRSAAVAPSMLYSAGDSPYYDIYMCNNDYGSAQPSFGGTTDGKVHQANSNNCSSPPPPGTSPTAPVQAPTNPTNPVNPVDPVNPPVGPVNPPVGPVNPPVGPVNPAGRPRQSAGRRPGQSGKSNQSTASA